MLIYSRRRLRRNLKKKKILKDSTTQLSPLQQQFLHQIRRNIPDRSADTGEPFIQSLLVLHIRSRMSVGREAALVHHVQSQEITFKFKFQKKL